MTDAEMQRQTRQRDLGDALAAVLREQEGAQRYRRRQRRVRRGNFMTRVARLLSPR
jgi:hypothetical protein